MRGIYLKSLSYPYSFGRFIFLELPNIQPQILKLTPMRLGEGIYKGLGLFSLVLFSY